MDTNDRTLWIFDTIAECGKYQELHPLFPAAFEFLRRPDIAELPDGKYEIVPDRCWAVVQEASLVSPGERLVEAHRRCIDIHVPLSGPELFGVAELGPEELALDFDEEKDVVLFKGPVRPVEVKTGEFAVFFPPCGGHAPCCAADGRGRLRKVVVKVVA